MLCKIKIQGKKKNLKFKYFMDEIVIDPWSS